MTCIVGIAENGRVLLSADSCVTVGDGEETTTPDTKVFAIGDWVVGVAGNWTAIVVARKIDTSSIEDIDGLYEAFRVTMRDAGLAPDEWDVLVGRDGKLWTLDGQTAPMRIDSRAAGRGKRRVTRSVYAIGSGSAYAIGSLDCDAETQETPRQIAERALAVAAGRASGVRPPWHHEER